MNAAGACCVDQQEHTNLLLSVQQQQVLLISLRHVAACACFLSDALQYQVINLAIGQTDSMHQ